MKKCDITISRKLKIDTGNQTSITPNITISMNGISMLKLKETYGMISGIADNLMALETTIMAVEQKMIKSIGLDEYIEQVENKKETIIKDVETLTKNLNDLK